MPHPPNVVFILQSIFTAYCRYDLTACIVFKQHFNIAARRYCSRYTKCCSKRTSPSVWTVGDKGVVPPVRPRGRRPCGSSCGRDCARPTRAGRPPSCGGARTWAPSRATSPGRRPPCREARRPCGAGPSPRGSNTPWPVSTDLHCEMWGGSI